MVFGNMTGNQSITQSLISSSMGFVSSNPPGSYIAAGLLVLIGLIIGWLIHSMIFGL